MKKYITIGVAGTLGLIIGVASFGLTESEAGSYSDGIVSEASFTAPVTHEESPVTPSEDKGYATTLTPSEIAVRATAERPESTTTKAVTTAVTTTVAETTTTTEVTTAIPEITVENLTAEAYSVSCIKVHWNKDEDREYEVTVNTDAGYTENIFILLNDEGCYLTGLRENSSYEITVAPILKDNENGEAIASTVECCTHSVEVIQEFPRENGWTNCFAGETAYGLTAQPSSGAIYGSFVDDITDTGIRRKPNGDYCCAMGLYYGVVGDRFLVELDNGVQFTVQICDSKGWADDADADSNGDGYMDFHWDEEKGDFVPDGDGNPDGRFHWFAGGSGKCIIEFVCEGNSAIPYTGSWGNYCWNGLNLCSNINSIKKINY